VLVVGVPDSQIVGRTLPAQAYRQVGQRLAQRLVAANHETRPFDRLRTEGLEGLFRVKRTKVVFEIQRFYAVDRDRQSRLVEAQL